MTRDEPSSDNIDCRHPRHRDGRYLFDEGRSYTELMIDAAVAASAGAPIGSTFTASAARAVLRRHSEACEIDLREFLAGAVSAGEEYLTKLGTKSN